MGLSSFQRTRLDRSEVLSEPPPPKQEKKRTLQPKFLTNNISAALNDSLRYSIILSFLSLFVFFLIIFFFKILLTWIWSILTSETVLALGHYVDQLIRFRAVSVGTFAFSSSPNQPKRSSLLRIAPQWAELLLTSQKCRIIPESLISEQQRQPSLRSNIIYNNVCNAKQAAVEKTSH